MIYNTAAVTANINNTGVEIELTHYPNLNTPTYDANQIPNYGTPSVTTPRAIMRDPTEFEIKNSGGLIDFKTKKFIVNINSPAEKGDKIAFRSNNYNIIEINYRNYKKDLFGSNQNGSEQL